MLLNQIIVFAVQNSPTFFDSVPHSVQWGVVERCVSSPSLPTRYQIMTGYCPAAVKSRTALWSRTHARVGDRHTEKVNNN